MYVVNLWQRCIPFGMSNKYFSADDNFVARSLHLELYLNFWLEKKTIHLFFFLSCDTSSWCNLTTCTLHEGIFARIRWKIYAFFRPTLKVDCTMRLLFHSMVGTAESHLCINFCQETNIWYNQSFCFLSWFFFKEFIT